MEKKYKIAVIGQGYVGLPLAIAFSRHYPVIGYDIDSDRIDFLKQGIDLTREARGSSLSEAVILYKITTGLLGLLPTNDSSLIEDSNVYIVTVPTPIDEFNAPNLVPLKEASILIGKILKEGDIVIYESTVFPGCTEEECVPVLESVSGLVYNRDFFVGYSPERINPGDKVNTLENIVKVTSGSTEFIAEEIDKLYQKIIVAGTHKANSIKVAEAAKVIENAQRDVNISFVNELALIFDRIGIDTNEVLEAAGTKFNFIKFKPGLVGGHCISVDPYYLAHKAIQLGYYPDVILSGRRVNDEIPSFIVSKVVKMMIKKGIDVSKSRVLILGFAFKENCPDTRNTKVEIIYNELLSYGIEVVIYDPWVSVTAVKSEFGIDVLTDYQEVLRSRFLRRDHRYGKTSQCYDAVIYATAHRQFEKINVNDLIDEPGVVYDVKGSVDKNKIDGRL